MMGRPDFVHTHEDENWLVRTLSGQATGGVGASQLLTSKGVLRTHCVIGLLDQLEGEYERGKANAWRYSYCCTLYQATKYQCWH